MYEDRRAYMVLVWKRERKIIGRVVVKGRIILICFLRSRMWAGSGQVAGSYDSGNEPSGSIKCGEYID
jgi:hypothetical protein